MTYTQQQLNALSWAINEKRGHIAVPLHSPLKLGTLSGILGDVASHLLCSKDELIIRLFQEP